jgi:hypothetical protein
MSDNPTLPLTKDELQKAKTILECCYADVLRAVIKNGRVTPNRGYSGAQGLGQAPVMPGLLRTVGEDIKSVERRLDLATFKEMAGVAGRQLEAGLTGPLPALLQNVTPPADAS